MEAYGKHFKPVEVDYEKAFKDVRNVTKKQFNKRFDILGSVGGERPVKIAYDNELKKKVSIKITDLTFGVSFLNVSDDILSISLKNDIRQYYIGKHIKHPNILAYYDMFTMDGNFFSRAYVVLVMQYVEGFTIAELYDNDTVVRGKIYLNLLQQYLSAVAYLRAKNIAQGDFDSTDVMISKDFRKIYIIDHENFCYDNHRITKDDFDFLHCSDMYYPGSLAKMWTYKKVIAVLYGVSSRKKTLKIVGEETEYTDEVAKFVFKNMSAYNVNEMITYIKFGLAS